MVARSDGHKGAACRRGQYGAGAGRCLRSNDEWASTSSELASPETPGPRPVDRIWDPFLSSQNAPALDG
jgi:hypothetical protein